MFYVAVIQNKTIPGLFAHATLDAALAAFHSELAYRGDERSATTCVILDESGTTIRKDVWERAAEQ